MREVYLNRQFKRLKATKTGEARRLEEAEKDVATGLPQQQPGSRVKVIVLSSIIGG